MDWQALLHIALHPRQNPGEKAFGVVFRAHDALDPVAADTVEQLSLLRIRAGYALDPFHVRQLSGEVLGLVELEVEFGFLGGDLLVGNFNRLRRIELITDRPNRQDVLSGCKPVSRKTEMAVGAGDDSDRDVGAGLGGADQHAFHRRFVSRTDQAGECRRGRLR
jgi:hypothetical protein